jgi:septum formation protein
MVLRQAGIDPMVQISGVNEDVIVDGLKPTTEPKDVVLALAMAKADAVARVLAPNVASDSIVIGCDSMLYHDGVLFGKPKSKEEAKLAWQRMAGSSGELFTGHCAIRMKQLAVTFRATQFSRTTVHFGHPSPSELESYVQSGEPTTVAGGFTLDGLGGWFIERIDGDPSTVIGIGLPAIRKLINDAGLSIPALWQANCTR